MPEVLHLGKTWRHLVQCYRVGDTVHFGHLRMHIMNHHDAIDGCKFRALFRFSCIFEITHVINNLNLSRYY